ncbi:MAG TPA: MSMEG_0565 family glycosyltransferase [Rhizobium sp.]
MSRSLRIAMLSHSTNPRGGVVHAMQLSEALTVLGHEVVLHAPDAKGTGFFRKPACGAVCIPVEPASADMTAMVEQRIGDYVRHFESPAARGFDIFHAHDGISGNALATLKEHGVIPAFARTVHHIDQFSDPRLMELQDRSIDKADLFFTVSALWQKKLKETRGIASTLVGNGVDINRFSPGVSGGDLRRKLTLPEGPVFLAVGGIEARKNTLGMLEAFRQMRAIRPDAQFVIAGGASLLDHRGYQGEFRAALASLGEHAAAVHILGTVADEDMPALYRLADTLVFASVKEGFGLVVLEAMASGVPVVVSSIAPFTEYLSADDAVWCDPIHPASIAEAMAISLMPPVRKRLTSRGLEIAAWHSWHRTAAAHLSAYKTLKEPAHA